MSANCAECPLRFRQHFQAFPTGPQDAEILVIGEWPVQSDLQYKKAFSGRGGGFFKTLLEKAQVPLTSCRFTNVLRCQPKTIKGTNLFKAAQCCRANFERDVRNAAIIIGTGELPLQILLGQSGIAKRGGSLVQFQENKWYLGTISPSLIIKSVYAEGAKIIPPEVVQCDLKKVGDLYAGKLTWDEEPPYDIHPTYIDFDEFLTRLCKPESLVGVDIETTYAIPDKAVPQIIAFALEDSVVVADFNRDLDFVANALISPTPKVFQNGLFDIRVLNGVGLRVEAWDFDTMYAHHLLYAELPHSLAFLQRMYTTTPYHKDMVSMKDKDTFLDK